MSGSARALVGHITIPKHYSTMPVIPPGIPPFKIRAPLTSTDTGAPSVDIRRDAQRVFDLIQDERHLTAHSLLQSVQQRVAASERRISLRESHKKKRGHFWRHKPATAAPSPEDPNDDTAYAETKALLEKEQAALEKLEVGNTQAIGAVILVYQRILNLSALSPSLIVSPL